MGEQLLQTAVDRGRMEISSSASPSTTRSMTADVTSLFSSVSMMNVPTVRRTMVRLLSSRSFIDAHFHPFLQASVTSGKMSVMVFVGVYFAILFLWLPFWLLAYLTGEVGVYAFSVVVIFMVGRSVIRMIAFPGSSPRVSSEIESEFAKYSVRMMDASSASIVDLASAVLGAANPSTTPRFAYYEIPGLWKRAKSYRNRVLGVYYGVLRYVLEDDDSPDQPPMPNIGTSTLSDTDKYGNNNLTGDVGNLLGLTARADGRELLKLLDKILSQMDKLEEQAKPTFECLPTAKPIPLSDDARTTCTSLLQLANELKDFVSSLGPRSDSEQDENLSADAVRGRFEGQSNDTIQAIKSGVASILPMLDPPLHESIFGFDVHRGCVLSRYRGARQFWVQRPNGGMIDVIHVPALRTEATHTGGDGGCSAPTQNPKAVLYCNPNAGLTEIATGMSLAGGNVGADKEESEESCWTDYYTNLGFDIYLFNYAGFGRSYGTTWCAAKRGGEEPFVPGTMGRIRRICHGTFLSFQPTPESLRADGIAVATHLVSSLGVDNLVIHGESIGGVAASGAARKLTESAFMKDKVSLLVCDRTFCNLEAVAQRLVGGWSGYAIRMLAPFWSTDVAGDFLAANCPKVVANDCADAIIADSSSLKSGISFWKEIHCGGASTTKGIGWIRETPIEYRMADWEDACVNGSRFIKPSAVRTQVPVWPADKHVTIGEAFHFAACAKRIGKLASSEKRNVKAAIGRADEECGGSGADVDCQLPVFLIWKILSCCDGLCGSGLGVVVKDGFDTTVAWLCTTLIFGGQTVVEAMEKRMTPPQGPKQSSVPKGQVSPDDFDCRPPDYEKEESEAGYFHPKPIPEVIETMKQILEDNSNDEAMKTVKQEIAFCIGTLEYVVARLSSPLMIESSWQNRNLQKEGMLGCFVNLHCGHNNPFFQEERERLKTLLFQAISNSSPVESNN